MIINQASGIRMIVTDDLEDAVRINYCYYNCYDYHKHYKYNYYIYYYYHQANKAVHVADIVRQAEAVVIIIVVKLLILQ